MGPDEDSILYYIHISKLVFKEIEDQPLSESERKDLDLWRAGSDARTEMYNRMRDRKGVMNELRSLNERYDPSEVMERVFETLDMVEQEGRGEPGGGKLWKRSLAAAAVLLLIATGWYFGTARRAAGPVAKGSVRYRNEIATGRNKVTLTLGDGSSIVLDSAKNGQLALQGDVRVEKKNGEVIYRGGRKESTIAYNTMATSRGRQYLLVLPDGTRVWLNAVSSVRYPTVFSGKERRVELSGEAYFDVAKDESKSFVVEAGNMDIKVLGTQFDVMAYADEGSHQATLIEGKVVVGAGLERVVMEPGQQAIVSGGGRPIVIDKHPDIDKAVAWRDGFFRFDHTDIKALMREISRWYDIEVVYETEDFSNKFGGRINRDLTLPELIKLLEGNGFGHFKIEGKKVIVLPSPPSS